MDTLFYTLTVASGLTGFSLGLLNFRRFWKYRAIVVKKNNREVFWRKAVKQSLEYRAMRRCLWAFYAWSFGTIIICNIALPYLKDLVSYTLGIIP